MSKGKCLRRAALHHRHRFVDGLCRHDLRLLESSRRRPHRGRSVNAHRSDVGPVDVLWGTDPASITTALETVDSGATVTVADPAPGARAFFRLESGDASITVAERRHVLDVLHQWRRETPGVLGSDAALILILLGLDLAAGVVIVHLGRPRAAATP